jgi:phosphatidate cytidylyltransferase
LLFFMEEMMKFNSKKVLPRLLVFFIGLPLVFSIVYFFPQRNHLLVGVVLVLLCGAAAFEIALMFAAKNVAVNRNVAVFLGMLVPLGAVLGGSVFGVDLIPGAVFAGTAFIVFKALFHPLETIEALLPRFAAETAILLYPGLLLSAVILLGAREDAVSALIFYLAVVLSNDSFAWFFGMLFGKGNRGVVKVSPNKSIAGFAGGILSSVALGLLFQRHIAFGVQGAGAVIAFCTALAATAGDLCESALKRSAGIKDSGRLFPGRGGVLDSLDSLAAAAPVFYFLYTFFAGAQPG